jgi:hypothetical protein
MSGHTCFRIYFKPEGSLTLSSTFGHTLDTTVVDVSLLMFCIVMLLCKVFNTWMEAQANYLPGSNMPIRTWPASQPPRDTFTPCNSLILPRRALCNVPYEQSLFLVEVDHHSASYLAILQCLASLVEFGHSHNCGLQSQFAYSSWLSLNLVFA